MEEENIEHKDILTVFVKEELPNISEAENEDEENYLLEEEDVLTAVNIVIKEEVQDETVDETVIEHQSEEVYYKITHINNTVFPIVEFVTPRSCMVNW